jgi:ParB/RepB/Spo0J family partition protein
MLDYIRIDQIHPSKTNPRKIFDAKSLKELADSIKTQGLQFPVLVRTTKDNQYYELVDGERRLIAAKDIGLKEIAAYIRDMTDEEAQEAQLISFIQTEGITPLEEAEAIEKYAAKKKDVTNKEIALKFGKSPKFIYQRRQLSKLIPEFKELLGKEKLSLSGATEICRLHPDQQAEALKMVKNSRWLLDNDENLINRIRDHFLLNLSDAPWKKDDATLLPKAGACTLCQKRTGANTDLFDDIKKKDLCLDHNCYKAKLAAFIEIKQKEYEDEGKKLHLIHFERYLFDKYSSDKGVIGSENFNACSLKEAKNFGIDVNSGRIYGIRLKNEKAEKSPGEKKDGPSYERRLELYKRRMEIFGYAIESEVRKRLLKSVLTEIRSVTKEDLALIADWIDTQAARSDTELVFEMLNVKSINIKSMNNHQLIRYIMALIITDGEMIGEPTNPYQPNDENLSELTKRYKIDRAGIERQVIAEMKPKEPKKPVKEPAVKKPAKPANKTGKVKKSTKAKKSGKKGK